MEKVKVKFYPTNVVAEAERGKSLLEVAQKAGISVASICGGDGICGKCRLIVQDGKVEANPTTLLTRDEIKSGYVMACQTKVLEDVEIVVPPESRGEGGQILVDEDAQRFRALLPSTDKESFFRHAPLVQKLYLELPSPTLQDNLAFRERLFRQIRRQIDAQVMQAGLKVIQGLPTLCRDQGWNVTATLGQRGQTTEVVQVEPGDCTGDNYGVAVDVGTSTVVVHLVDLSTSETVDTEACYNSQARFGAEITRRIIHAERNGLQELRDTIVSDINNLISTLVSRNQVDLHGVNALCAAGNMAMLHFLLGLDPSGIRKGPYISVVTAPPPVRAAEVGIRINPRGLFYTMPGIGSWVGGDITAGVLATGLYEATQLTMLIDVGTNGEIVLGNRDWMLSCATSAGPAFEGSGVKCGMKAIRGAIERVEISADGQITYRVIGNEEEPEGICGSGLIDLIANLFRAGILDRSGNLVASCSDSVRTTDGQPEFVLVPGGQTRSGRDIVVTQPDIENVLRAKAAIYAGVKTLLESTDHQFDDVEQLFIAGGFGNYLDRRNVITLGMIPDIPLERIRFVGNTSLVGAKMALLSTEAHDTAHEIARIVTYYDLITHPGYFEEFIAAKFLPHTDLSLFPSVAGLSSLDRDRMEKTM